MTNYLSRSDEVSYSSTNWVESQAMPGVRFQLLRLSFGRRVGLTRSIRQLWQRLEYHEAGKTISDELSRAVVSAELDAEYLRWALVAIEGLTIDGVAATVESLIESGPEVLSREIVSLIKGELGLTEDERKN